LVAVRLADPTVAGADVVRSRRCCCPSGDRGAQPEGGEAGEVLGGGEKVEVGVDFASAALIGEYIAV